MNIDKPLEEERAVSPVIGVILMVAVTVLLAATAATFFLGLGDTASKHKTPTAAFDFDYEAAGGGQLVKVRHASGDTLRADDVRVVVSDATCTGGADPNGRHAPADLAVSESEIRAGVTARVQATYSGSPDLCPTGDLILESAEIQVVWTGPEDASSTTLARWKGPDA